MTLPPPPSEPRISPRAPRWFTIGWVIVVVGVLLCVCGILGKLVGG